MLVKKNAPGVLAALLNWLSVKFNATAHTKIPWFHNYVMRYSLGNFVEIHKNIDFP